MRARAALALAVAVLVGCGDGSDPPTAVPAGDGGADLAAFDRTAETVTGDRVELAAYADRDLVVWFWAPW